MSESSNEPLESGRWHRTRTHTALIGIVTAGGVVIASIGFVGSYAAVQRLARAKGFGFFAHLYPIGVDAGIVVLLAMDLLMARFRIPFPLLRQAAWLLTASTVAFNGASSWPDLLGVSMHAVIPLLFCVSVEAGRHAIGRYADITVGADMDSICPSRWLLAPLSTSRLWRRMKLFELRRYEDVIKQEQNRLVYEARLEADFGRGWRRKAPVEALLPLRLARYGVPLELTAAHEPVPEATQPRPPIAPRPKPTPTPRPQQGGRPKQPPTTGRSVVRDAYENLSDAERALSTRALAEKLAPRLGLAENTVRVYLGEVRRKRGA